MSTLQLDREAYPGPHPLPLDLFPTETTSDQWKTSFRTLTAEEVERAKTHPEEVFPGFTANPYFKNGKSRNFFLPNWVSYAGWQRAGDQLFRRNIVVTYPSLTVSAVHQAVMRKPKGGYAHSSHHPAPLD